MNDPEAPPDPDGETRERGSTGTDRPTNTVHGQPSAVGRRLAARYEILEALGSGGFGAVYRAHDELLDRMVALKVARKRPEDSTTAGRFQREARATARLEHPHAVRIYDAGEDVEGLFLVLELVSGESVQERLRRGVLPAATVAAVGRQAASALAAAHALGIVHRDIKPANLLLTADGQVKVADFGVARLLGEERLTSEGGIVGTPDYMAPEQVEGGEIGPSADMFALGIVLYEMLTGNRPFGKGTTSEILARIVRADVPPLPPDIREREPALCRTILALLNKKPEDRPSAAEVAAGGSTHERPAPRREGTRRWWLLGITATLAVIATVVVVTRGWRTGQGTANKEPESSGASAPSPPPAPPETRTVTLARFKFGAPPGERLKDTALTELQRVLQVAADAENLTVMRTGGRDVLVKAPGDRIEHATTALALLDALDREVFAKSNLFTGREPSACTISFSLHGLDISRFLYVMGAATGWSVVVDDAVRGPTTMQLNDVPWDVATQTLLDMSDLRSIRFGDVWIVTTRKRAVEIEGFDTPFCSTVVPRRTTAAKLAALLESARSDRGVVVVNRRLGSVAFADRTGLITRYAGIVATVEGAPLARPYTGARLDLSFHQAPLHDVLAAFADTSGLNVVAQPGLGGGVTVNLRDVPWDNALDAILRAQGLRSTLQGNLLTIARPEQSQETLVETVGLMHEDPRFFLAFAKCLTPAGTLRADETSRALVVRDVPERARWFVGMVKQFDIPAPR